MRRAICLVCMLMVLLTVCPTRAEDNGPLAFDFDLGFSLDPTAFPAENRRDAEGWGALLEKSRLSGNWTEAGDGSDCFDITLNLAVTDRKTASVPVHVFGHRYGAYITSPLLADQRLYFNFAGWLKIALKMYDYFEIPLQEPALLLRYANDYALQKLRAFWREAFKPKKGKTHYSPKQLKKIAAQLRTVLAEDTDLMDWISAIGIRSGLDTLLLEEADMLDLYVEDAFSEGLTVERSGSQERWITGETVLMEKESTDTGEAFELHLPATPENGLTVDISWRKTDGELTLTAKLAAARETYLDLRAEGAALPETAIFTEPFSLTVCSSGFMTGNVDCRVTGEVGEADARALTLYLKDPEGNEKEAFRTNGTIRPLPEAANPSYGGELTWDSVYLTSLTEYSLSELTNKIAGSFARGILPVLVEIPPISCQVILDELTECGVLQLLSGDFELEH